MSRRESVDDDGGVRSPIGSALDVAAPEKGWPLPPSMSLQSSSAAGAVVGVGSEAIAAGSGGPNSLPPKIDVLHTTLTVSVAVLPRSSLLIRSSRSAPTSNGSDRADLSRRNILHRYFIEIFFIKTTINLKIMSERQSVE